MAEIDLMNLQPQKISKDLRGKFALIYGEAGCGKTSLAASFDRALICGFERGTNALNNIYVQPIKTWSDWKKVVKQLIKNDALADKYHCIAIDTADEAWELCVKWICEQNGISELGELPWGRGYDIAKKEFADGFRQLTFAGYGLIFTSHAVEKKKKDDDGNEYEYIQPALQTRPFDIINKMVDVIAYIRELNVGTEEEPDLQRFMFFRDDSGSRFRAKSRFKYIAHHCPLDYNSFVDAVYNAIDEETKHSGGESSDMADPYSQLDYDELIEEAKIYWTKIIDAEKAEEAGQILEEIFGKPTKFSEITKDQTDKLFKAITEIKELV